MEIASLGLAVRSDGVVVASDRLNRFGRDADRAEVATNRLTSAFRSLAPIVGAVTAAFSVRALRDYADSWSDMQSRIGAAVKDMEAAPALMERIVDIANASYSPLAQTAEVYSRNMATLRDYGRGAMEAADFTEALNHALVITATKGQDADVVINSYSRAISNGKLRTMEFETIMSRSPRLLESVADHLGVTVTELRRLAAAGKVTGKDLIDGPLKSLELLREQAAEMPATVGDAFQRISTNFQALVGRVDQATGSSEALALKFVGLADSIRAGTDDVVRAALVIQTGLTAAMEWASNAASALGSQFDSSSAMIVAGAGAAGFAVTALATAITGVLIRSIVALGVALASNPFALLIAGAAAAVAAAYLFRDEINEIVGTDVFKIFYDGANQIIGQMKGAFDAVIAIWQELPGQFGIIGKLAWNALMDGLSGDVIKFTNPFTGEESSFGLDFSSAKVVLTETEKDLEGTARAAYNAAQGVDYLSGAGDTLARVWTETGERAAASFADLANGVNSVGTAMDDKASKAAKKLADAYKRITDGARQFIEEQRLEAELIGMTEVEANRLRYAQDLLNDAKRAGIALTAAQTDELRSLAAQMADSEAATKALRESFEEAKRNTKSFVSDLRAGIDQGKGFFRSFADAAINALNRIVDKLLNDVIDAMFQVSKAGSGMGGGGFFGSIFSGIGKLFGFSGGGWTGNGSRSGVAGVVHGQEYVVRAGPAAQHRQLLEAMNAGKPVAANTNQPQHVVVEVRGTFVDDNGVIRSQVTTMGQQAAQAGATVAVRQVKQALPSMIADSQARKM